MPISLFATREGAEVSTERAAAWVMENVADQLAGSPEVLEGPVRLHIEAPAS